MESLSSTSHCISFFRQSKTFRCFTLGKQLRLMMAFFCARQFIILDSIIIIDELPVCSFVEYMRRSKCARIEAQWRHGRRHS